VRYFLSIGKQVMDPTLAAFDRFLRNISPKPDELARANEHVRLVRDRINQTMPFLDNLGKPNQAERFPDNPHIWIDENALIRASVWVLGKSIIGSAARQTQLSPIEDVDILLILQCTSPIILNSWTPAGLLKNLSNTLAGIGTELVTWEGECVTVKFANAPYCDVFPAFNFANQRHLLFPKRGNQWYRGDPTILDGVVKTTDQVFNGRLRPFIKLLKYWNKLHSVGLKTFHLETLAVRELKQSGSLPAALHSFFLHGKQSGRAFLTIPSLDGAVEDMSQYLTSISSQEITKKIRVAEKFCRSALDAYGRNDSASAMTAYRLLFGLNFGE